MLKIKEAIIVEGRYDKNALSQVVDTVIVETGGFGVFNDKERVRLFRRLAERRGIIILTDSDGAGFLIRSHLKGCLPPEQVKHAHIPDVLGKERRKRHPGKEGKLGVEGMRPEVLEQSLRRAGATFLDGTSSGGQRQEITKADLYAWGYCGGTDSAKMREALLRSLDLPQRLTTNGMLAVLNSLMTREEFLAFSKTQRGT